MLVRLSPVDESADNQAAFSLPAPVEHLMAHAGFPSLKTDPSDPFYEMDQLATHPNRWRTAPVADLGQVLTAYALLWAGTGCPEHLTRPLKTLHGVFVERASEEDRLEALSAIGRYAEEGSRQSQAGHHGMACALFLRDPSALVVSTAAILMASLIQPPGGAEMAGPKLVLDLVLETEEARCRAAGLAGLLAIGEGRMTALLDGCWKHLDDEGRGVLAQLGVGQFPTPQKVDFFLKWAESAVEGGDEEGDGLGIAAAGLVNLANRAVQLESDGEPPGVIEIDRAFPAWSRPFDSVVRVADRWTLEEYATTVAPRLIDIARREHPPRVGPTILRAWGLPDVPFVEAVARAVAGQGGTAENVTVFAPPLEVDVHPDRDQTNVVMEWGIINPNGPTMCQISLVDVGPAGHALVWTMHHCLAPECLVYAAGHLQDVDSLQHALAQAFAANGSAEHPLLKSLPHWVRIPTDGPLTFDDVVGLVASAHRRRLEADGLRGEHPDSALAALWRLAKDPIAECRREEERALVDYAPVMKAMSAGDDATAAALLRTLADSPALGQLPVDDAYRRWLQFACEPACVEKIRGYCDSAWKEAIRRHNDLNEPPQNEDTPEQS